MLLLLSLLLLYQSFREMHFTFLTCYFRSYNACIYVQAQGLKPKTKTLEEVLKSTFKKKPKLIGYDETPIDVTDATTIGQLMANGDLCNKSNPEIRPIQEVADESASCVKPVGQQLQSFPKEKLQETSRKRDCASDSSKTGNVKTVVVLLCQIVEPSWAGSSYADPNYCFTLFDTKEQQDRDCMNYVLLIAGNLLNLNAARKRDQTILSCEPLIIRLF